MRSKMGDGFDDTWCDPDQDFFTIGPLPIIPLLKLQLYHTHIFNIVPFLPDFGYVQQMHACGFFFLYTK